MATTAKIAKSEKKAKFTTREHNRCKICGRPKAYIRHFGMCRLCFRDSAKKGHLPGVTKASW
ncbi:MAG: type Z 30S ribosomal protein S14 [bacterium]